MALGYFKNGNCPFDIIFMDIELGEFSGIDLAEKNINAQSLHTNHLYQPISEICQSGLPCGTYLFYL